MSLEYILQSWIKSKIVVELLLLLPRRPTFGGFVSIRSYRLNHYRLLNLELLQNYGASMWLGHNKSEEGTEAAVASQVCHLPSPPFFFLFFPPIFRVETPHDSLQVRTVQLHKTTCNAIHWHRYVIYAMPVTYNLRDTLRYRTPVIVRKRALSKSTKNARD